MTLNHQNVGRNELSCQKSHEEEVLHLFLAQFGKKIYFRIFDFEIHF